MQRGFSSLGAPYLDMRELSGLAREFGLDFLELRAVKRTIALPDYFRDHPQELSEKSTPVRVLSTDLRLIDATDENVAAFMRCVELAESWGAPYVRVFGGGSWGAEIPPELLMRTAGAIVRCRRLMVERGFSCEILLETHSAFSSAAICRRLNGLLERPLAILWDSHHTWKLAGEPLVESWRQIGDLVRHIHYKDSVSSPGAKDGYRYVLPGLGEFPSEDLFDLLARVRYRGGISLEWEKFWHPELPELPEALARFKQIGERAG
jgi:sugar phosphate isomerase/epimerase